MVVDDGLYTHRWVTPLLDDSRLDIPAVAVLSPFQARGFNPGGARGLLPVTLARLRLYGLAATLGFAALWAVSRGSVATAARCRGREILRPEKGDLADPAFLRRLEEIAPDFLVWACSQRATERLLGLPRSGCLGVHFSMLPRHRGREPLLRAMLEGGGAGVSVFRMVEGLDEGPVLAGLQVPLYPTLHRQILAACAVAAGVVADAVLSPTPAPPGPSSPLRSWPTRDEVARFRSLGLRFL